MIDSDNEPVETAQEAPQAALVEVLRVIGSSGFDLDAVLRSVLESALRLCRADVGTIYLADGDVFRIGAAAGPAREAIVAYERDNPHRPGRESMTGRVLLSRQPVQIEDVLGDPEYDQPDAVNIVGYRSLLGLPIIRDDQIVGVFNLGRSEVRPYSESEIELVTTFAEQAGAAIANARLIATIERQRQESVDRQAAQTEILRIIGGSAFDLQAVLDRVVVSAAHLSRAEYANLYLDDGDGTFRLIASMIEPHEIEYERKHPHRAGRESLIGRVILSEAVVHIDDILTDAEYSNPLATEGGYRTLLGVPIHREGRLIGALAMVRKSVQPFTEAEIQLASTFAEQAGIAIENARLIETIERQRREQFDRQTALNEILQIIGDSSFDLQQVLEAVSVRASSLAHAEFANLYLEEGDGTLRLFASRMSSEEIALERQNPHRAGRDSAAGRVMLSGEIAHIEDISTDPEYDYAIAVEGGYRTLLGVPIRREDRLVAVMVLARKVVQPFTDAEVLLVTIFAEQAGIAIENARQLETIERQRSELGRFISPQIAELVSSPAGEQLLAGHRRQITAVFSDLRGFSQFAETAEPEELLGVLRDYHAAMGALIVEHEGTLEHFAGDGMLVFFNDPVVQDDHAARAVAMAIAMRSRFAGLAEGWQRMGFDLGLGVGIATGYATLGRIGYEGRYDYAAVGTAVILASRLSTEAKAGQILIGQRTMAAIDGAVPVAPVGELTLKGISRPVAAFEVPAVD